MIAVCACVSGGALARVGVQLPGTFWSLMLSGVLLVTGIVLVLASRDLRARGAIVYYEGLARLIAAALLMSAGVLELGTLAYVLGVADLCLGLGQVFAMPRSLGRTHWQLLKDAR